MSKNQAKQIETVNKNGITYFKIPDYKNLAPFFISIVSSSNHWLFLGSHGGISAGRKNAEHALFPYYTHDKVMETAEITGSKTIIRLKDNQSTIWEPFSNRREGHFKITRNLYKSCYGDAIIFEEINHDLSLQFSYQWQTSPQYGFVRTAKLKNISANNIPVEIVDGIQNILPQLVGSELQNRLSNLVDAYKRNELHQESQLAIYALSAMIVDKAEPREALKANIVWSDGLAQSKILLSSLQLDAFRNNEPIQKELDVKGEKGSYFNLAELILKSNEEKIWYQIADVNKTQEAIVDVIDQLEKNELTIQFVKDDIQQGREELLKLNASADALSLSADSLNDARHFSNVLFNIMRGGVFDNNYQIEKEDFIAFVQLANKNVYTKHKSKLHTLPQCFTLFELKEKFKAIQDANLKRIGTEYLPLKFSRRHGDPSRPWNKFSINTQNEIDGSKILDYEGNWRDIFQNWEALAHSFPAFIEGMLFKFLNATTFDGYNPYRVVKEGFDWETIEPDNPWSYIGYWGDHQIIYLLKFLEFIDQYYPQKLLSLFDEDIFVYANVPYKIKSFSDIVKNPKETINFDFEEDENIRAKREVMGIDGALLMNEKNEIYHVNFIEKILATVLAKIANFIPEGGIWMNTQRPEWNDANNALVGNGISMVTLYYLHRFLQFFDQLLEKTNLESIKISSELMDFYKGVRKTLLDNEDILLKPINDKKRRAIVKTLGEIASDFREHIYQSGFWGKKRSISIKGLKSFTSISLRFIKHSIQANERHDGLFHAYNLSTFKNEELNISYLSEMLEGQVAILSAKYLNPQEALQVLDQLKNSALFREDQYSYILYPNKNLPGFLAKNNIPNHLIKQSSLLQLMIKNNDKRIVVKDRKGNVHFNGNFAYANDVEIALNKIDESDFKELVKKEKTVILSIFEEVFDHKSFTGRSGTFFGYEGLGSIYWHMVSKLLLAVQECTLAAIDKQENEVVIGKLMEHYYEIQAGIGVHKPPSLYGAFPTDPYSHTPAGRGAQQPGMTGQVKEDILSKWGELGVYVKNQTLHFNPRLLRRDEFLQTASKFEYFDVNQNLQVIEIPSNSLCFTYCQVPIIYQIADKRITKLVVGGKIHEITENYLNESISRQILNREGVISKVIVQLLEADLR